MKINASLCFILLAPILVSGCATITKDANQNVQIETYSKDNQPISGAKCTAQNERGQWTTTSTGSVYVHRSGQNLIVTCDKAGEETGHGTAISRANGGMFGNILFGGGIGAIVDHNKGTAYTYPSWLRVVMGQSLVYDRKDEVENSPMTGKSALPEEQQISAKK
ncbi:MAG: hypothetical protein WC696_03155 [Candidatus Methylopumilus sp.]|jgi:hypothetical protein